MCEQHQNPPGMQKAWQLNMQVLFVCSTYMQGSNWPSWPYNKALDSSWQQPPPPEKGVQITNMLWDALTCVVWPSNSVLNLWH